MFSKVTLLLDGTHCPIEYSEFESLKIWQHNPVSKKDYISYKKKFVAMNTQVYYYNIFVIFQVVMASNGFICAVSSSKPAGKFNDQKMWRQEREYLTQVRLNKNKLFVRV
jgi:hypothetical protein